MNSILTIITPAATQDLTTLATVKSELDITTSDHDEKLARYIRQASGTCADYCNRVFGAETVSELFRLGSKRFGHGSDRQRIEELRLARFPVSSIVSVTENDTVLASSDYEIDTASGLLQRLSSGYPSCWSWNKIIVQYTAGYALLGALPQGIEAACIELVKMAWYASRRDPAIKSEQTDGVDAVTYFFGTPGEGGLPDKVTDKLNTHRDPRVG